MKNDTQTLKLKNKEKVLVISDLHLDKKWNQQKFDFLQHLFSNYDQIVLNGDFWYDVGFKYQKFINSKWSGLFETLKDKKTVYINGNHDERRCSDENISLFCDYNPDKCIVESAGKTFLIEHGHKNSPATKLMYLVTGKSERLLFIATRPFYFYWYLHHMLVRSGKKNWLKFINTEHKTKNRKKCNYLITGHTHVPEACERYKYYNSGFVNYGYASYIEIHDGSIRLIEKRYDN